MNDNLKEIRWKQRFSNLEKSFLLLRQTSQNENLNMVEKAGFIKFFEISFELSWKTLKDYLDMQGYQVISPRDVLKTAFEQNLISEGREWLEALNNRNLAAHTYDETRATEVEQLIRHNYLPLIQSLYDKLKPEV